MSKLVLCESCDKRYPASEVQRVREDDEGAYWNLCEGCRDAIADTFDEMEARNG